MRKLITAICLATLFFAISLASSPATLQKSEAKPELNAEKLVNEWMRRLNGLEKWYISMDGREQTEEVVGKFLEMYAPDALQTVGPAEDQMGTVMLRGVSQIRKWADDFARSYVILGWRINVQTEFVGPSDRTTSLVYVTPTPWGGLAGSFELTAVYSLRKSRRKFMAPGTVFMQFREDGKIQRLRLYLQRDETVEIFP